MKHRQNEDRDFAINDIYWEGKKYSTYGATITIENQVHIEINKMPEYSEADYKLLSRTIC